MTSNARWLALVLAVLPLVMTSASHAQVAAALKSGAPHVITRPDWLYRPTGQEANQMFPKQALREKVEGRVVLKCIVDGDGMMTECTVASEIPEGYGFGEAALKLSDHFVMWPKTIDGVPVGGGSVTIPIPFRLNPSPSGQTP